MGLLQKILDCKDEEIDSIISEAIKGANIESKDIKTIGFLPDFKSNSVFKGFIPLNTRIKYSNFVMEDYGMESTDFIYEFAHFIKNKNINNGFQIIYNLELFINKYFGLPGKIDREQIFNQIAWENSKTDDEYFELLSKNKLGDLKGKGAAQCTERSALAQQVLSLFGFEVYYCMGCVGLSDREEGHCFNIVKRKNDYALLDYSVPVNSYDNNGKLEAFYPFVGILTPEEFGDFIENGTIKSFNDYYFSSQKKETNNKRSYVVGRYTLDNENEFKKNR